MAIVLPFHGLLPGTEQAAKVAAVPYDVINTEEAIALAKGNPLSFLRVSRPEIELEPGIDLHDDQVYAKAAANFQRLCKEAPLGTGCRRTPLCLCSANGETSSGWDHRRGIL